MRLILARHGETEENKEKILQGWLPGKLSDEGKAQARLLSERLRYLKINYIYTSDLERCVETAEAIAKYHPNVKFIETRLLRERGFGDFEGKKKGTADWDALGGDIFTNRPPRGETIPEVYHRLEKFYKKIIKKHIHDTILIVGPGGSICLLTIIIQKRDLKDYLLLEKHKNTAISEIEIDSRGNYKTICYNCEKHLKNKKN